MAASPRMMAPTEVAQAEYEYICQANELDDGGKGVRFSVKRGGRDEPAFVIRFAGQVRGFLNRCAHVPVELDWQEGEFFDHSRLYLICAVHGALYDPQSGRCLGGRCNRRGLVPISVVEREGSVFHVIDVADAGRCEVLP